MKHRSIAACLLLLGVLCTSPATAQDGPTSAQNKAAAVALAEQGWAHYQARRYTEALHAFREAETKAHAPPFLLMVARCYAELGRLLDARAVYQLIVDEKLAPGAPSAFSEAKADAMSELAELETRIPAVEVTVPGAVPAGLDMTLDGLPIKLSTPVQRDPGAHTLVVRRPGRLPLTKAVQLTEGARERVELDQVTLDALPMAERPEADAGQRTVRLDNPGVRSPAQGNHSADTSLDTKKRTAVLIGGGAAAALGIASGAIFAALAGERASHAEETRKEMLERWNGVRRCPGGDVVQCKDLSNAVDAEIAYSNIAFWSLVAGGTIGVGTLVYGLLTKEPATTEPVKPESSTQAAPLLGPGTAGLSISGTF